MSSTISPSTSPRWKSIGFWVVKIVFALLFLATGAFKFSGVPAVVAEFDEIGLGQWFRFFTGACEIVGAILLLIPRTTPYGAILLFGVSTGAFIAQAFLLHQDVIHTLVFMLVFGSIAWVTRGKILALSVQGVAHR